MSACEYNDPTLCVGDELVQADPTNSVFVQLKDYFASVFTSLFDQIINLLNTYVGGLGSRAFEDIYTSSFCGPSLLSSPITAAIAFSILFYVLLYLLGVLLRNNKFISMAKTEFWEMLFLFPLVAMLLQIPCLHSPFSDVTFYQGALLYLHSAVTSTILSVVPFTVGYGVIISSQVSLSQSWIGHGPPDSRPAAMIYTESIKMLFGNAAVFLTLGYLSIASFLYMFDLLTYGMIKYILPFALLLRFIPPTKRIGGGLIGVALGLAIFMPLVFWINYELIKAYGFGYYELVGGKAELRLNPLIHDIIGYSIELLVFALILNLLGITGAIAKMYNFIKRKIGTRLSEFFSKFLPSLGKGSGAAVRLVYQGISAFTFTKKATLSLVYILTIIVSMFVISFAIMLNLVLPAITFIVVATGVRALSGLFGQEIDISNLTRLV